MNKQKAILFLFSIAKEIEKSFRCPIIFLTEKDYADYIVKSLMGMHCVLQDKIKYNELFETIKQFHYEWLQAVQDIELFKKMLKELPRDVPLRAIDFTIDCLENRYTYLCNYMREMETSMPSEEKKIMGTNLTIIAEIKQINVSKLLEKKRRILTQVDQAEYLNTIQNESEELLNWLDRINDNLALHFCRVLDLKVSIQPSDLTKPLKQIIEEISDDPDPEAQRIADLIHSTCKKISTTIRLNSIQEIEIAKIVQKIKELENRINRLELENSSALMALKNKTIYLEDRLKSLENVKLSKVPVKSENIQFLNGETDCIFNHILPHAERCRLVERLMKLWNSSTEHENESIISILSVADLKEVFSDVHGRFCVDKYGRKLYDKCNNTQLSQLYQLNEVNKLVPVQDDEKHVYFYDECGRYYLNGNNQRIYKAYATASEYILNKTGVLLKLQEVKGGIEYFYDNLGRYHFNLNGKRIYTNENSENEYEDDGLGNLLRIKSRNYTYEPYTKKPLTLEENKYLKRVVGPALKECVAKVVLHRPNDPIAYLSMSLIKYWKNTKDRNKHLDDKREMFEERDLYCITKENSSIQLKNYDMDYTLQDEASYSIEYETEEAVEEN
ncbi:unnamed protein product [Arctia plantaginis]|uniref:Uncharacterized protein n=1 Tax=Arctia plantaginis TaxID=874455 RepID=A0A8S0Z382_ARCPL|nr:unnamed protein product [Arctia plantaginis]CAB3242400.1 unnamed protein product [Arctia plantaginis]